jgi:pimeloyl-ACP methyl ester carboxylesterase
VGGFVFGGDIMTPVPGRVETFNGVQLYFEVHGSGEPLVLLHGFGGCRKKWKLTHFKSKLTYRNPF